MSKLDAQRAMKVARYDAAQAASSTRPAAKAATKAAEPGGKPAATRAPKSRAKVATTPASDAPAPELCGHRSIQGKTCKRPIGHSEASHKYT